MPDRAGVRLSARGRVAGLAPLLIGALLLGGLALAEPARRAGARDEYRIPAGTAARIEAGLPVGDVLPPRIETWVGTELVVVNEDEVQHVFGPFVLDPGQSWSRQFASPGTYGVSCSVYPTAQFEIVADTPPEAAGPAAVAHRALTALWAALGGVLVGALALALAASGPGAPETDTPPGAAGGLGLARCLALALPGATAVLLASGALALSRVADWGPVLTSRAGVAWWAAVALALAVAAVVRRFVAPVARPPLERLGLAALLTVVLLVVGLWPGVGGYAVHGALAAAGAGLLVVAMAHSVRGDRRQAPAAGWLAAVGLAVFVVGLPWPTPTPPWRGLVGLATLAVGAVLVVRAMRVPGGAHSGPAWLVGGAGVLVTLLGLGLMWAAAAAYLEAVVVPVYGNPVPATVDSVARGEALWDTHCAECHQAGEAEAPPAEDTARQIADTSDRQALQTVTSGGETMPGFAYELDISARGDVLNFLRSLAPSGLGDGEGGG